MDMEFAIYLSEAAAIALATLGGLGFFGLGIVLLIAFRP
jgi:hypothetical protein